MVDQGSLRGSDAAALVLTYRDAIRATWQSLFEPQESGTGSEIIRALSDATLIAFAGYLRGDDFGRAALAQQWAEVRPDSQKIVEAVVSMSLLPEAMRRSAESIPEHREELAALVGPAASYIRRVTTGVLQSNEEQLDPVPWDKVSHELEVLRLRRAARLGVLTDIARVITTSERVDDLFEQVRHHCARALDVRNFLITLYDPERHQLVPRMIYLNDERRSDLEGGESYTALCELVADSGEPINTSDYLRTCAEHQVQPTPLVDLGGQFACMAAPMVQNGQVTGVIAILSATGPFQHEDLDLLVAVAQQTAVALNNRRLLMAAQRRAEQLNAVNTLVERIGAVRDPDRLIAESVELIHQLFGYSFVSLLLIDQERRELTLRAHSRLAAPAEAINLRLPLGERSIVADVAATGEPISVGDVSRHDRYISTPETASTCSEIAVPLRRNGQVLGVLDIQSPLRNAFDQLDTVTLAMIADQIVLAIESARLFSEEQVRSQALALMLRTTREAGSSLVLDEVLERLALGIAEAASSPQCTIYLLDDDGTTFAPTVSIQDGRSSRQHQQLCGHPLSIDLSPTLQRLVAEQQPVVYDSPRSRKRDRVFTKMCGAQPMLMVPLVAKGRTLGLALVVAGPETGSFSPERIRLIQGVADSAALTVENARLYANSQSLAIAEERGRLAHEIHDGLAQGLTGISLQLDLADAYLPGKPEQAKEKVRRALELTRINLEEARRSVLDLRTARGQEVPLPDALRRLVQTLAHDTGVSAEFSAEGLPGRLSARLETGLYRITEEALANIRKHASACRVRVTLSTDSGMVELRVADDGKGFDPTATKRVREPGAGFGLIGMRERARLLKGTLQLHSAEAEGTELVVTVPFEPSRVGQAERG